MKALLGRLQRRLFRPPPRVVRLHAAQKPARGSVMLSYLTDCFDGNPKSHYHTNRWECRCMAAELSAAGYDVVIINYDDRVSKPPPDCVAVIDLHSNLERLGACLAPQTRKIHHATGAHWKFQNEAEQTRLCALEARRGVRLPPRRQVPPSKAAETADLATTTGNAFTIGTFSSAEKQFHRIPISSTHEQDWPAGRTFETARRKFLWFGSHGLVHKGLDIVLEAFAQLPDLQLTVAGPIAAEPDFADLYSRELSLPNVHVLGWIETHSKAFSELLTVHGSIVYPSCSEGGGGSVITCLHGGLVPIVTREASVDVGDFGIELRNAEVGTLVSALSDVASLNPSEIEARGHAAWEFARSQHTRENFERTYRRLVAEVFRL